MIPTTELLISELMTEIESGTHAGEVTLRLVNEKALVCEVLDNSGALPRLRRAGGRTAAACRSCAARSSLGRPADPTGKVVWCEQPLPGSMGAMDDIGPLRGARH